MSNITSSLIGVLIVDDEPAFTRSLSIMLERSCGLQNIQQCNDSRDVTSILKNGGIEMVLLDLNMPHFTGEQVLAEINTHFPDIAVIIISGMNDIETAVKCVKMGAYDYFVKTVEETRLVEGIKRVALLQQLKIENRALRKPFQNNREAYHHAFAEIVTISKAMHAVFYYLEAVAKTNQAILITGESGVGKELLAKATHEVSGSEGPLIPVNIAGLDDAAFSDTLFGHEKGAFTGADRKRGGLIEKAAGGTLFLDEIGDLSMDLQVKLLRVLQEGEYYPLGSDKPKKLEARIIACTHQNLDEKQKNGEYRSDLYYRLKTHYINVPALRERKEDIPLLLNHFIDQAAQELEVPRPAISIELLKLLSSYSFPGNIRELRSMAFDAMSLCRSDSLPLDRFEDNIQISGKDEQTKTIAYDSIFSLVEPLPSLNESANLLVSEAMKRAAGNQSVARQVRK